MGDLGDGTGSSYPAALDTDTNQEVNSPSASKTKARAEVPNDLAAAVIAVQTELGIDPAGTVTDVKTFLQTEHDTDGTHNDTAMSTLVGTSTFLNYTAGLFSRSKFEYIDANTIYIGAGQYWVKDKFAWWDAQLTSSDIGTPTASTMVYLYLDYSAITSGTEITNTELVWSEDPPAYSHASRAWLRTVTNTDDRCIFAVYSDASQNITEFFQNGDFIIYGDMITDRAAATSVSNNWVTEATLTIPTFSTKANVTFSAVYVAADTTDYLWRTDGQAGTTGHKAAYADINVPLGRETTDVITGATQKIDLKDAVASSNNTLTIWTNGWYFGVGI